MSQKITTFVNVIAQPLNVHNFQVSIAALSSQVNFVCQSTKFPSEKMRTTVLYTYGEEIRYPAIPQNSGEWPFQVPEDESGTIRKEIDAVKEEQWDQSTGALTPQEWYDIRVSARSLANEIAFSVILKGCWIIGREDVNLANNDPTQAWKWDYAFRYQYIKDE